MGKRAATGSLNFRCVSEPGAGVEHYAGRTSASPAIAGPLTTLPACALRCLAALLAMAADPSSPTVAERRLSPTTALERLEQLDLFGAKIALVGVCGHA